jgi:ATP-dependent Clp protease ATP-binding subunit ClpA
VVFERFTENARQVVRDARSLAIDRGDDQIRALHMLSALTLGDGVAARVLAASGVDADAVARVLGPSTGTAAGDAQALAAIGIDLDEIKRKIEENFGEGALDRLPASGTGHPLSASGPLRGHSALTGDAKMTLAASLKEARALHHDYIGTEHLLLGLLRTADSATRGRASQSRPHQAPGSHQPPGSHQAPGSQQAPSLQQALTTLGLHYATAKDQVLALLTTRPT